LLSGFAQRPPDGLVNQIVVIRQQKLGDGERIIELAGRRVLS
jgi:hypothetical protein